MISALDKSKLKAFSRGDMLSVMQRLAQDMIEEWEREVPTGSTQFEYLRSALERDGKMMGVSTYLKRIEEIAYKQ